MPSSSIMIRSAVKPATLRLPPHVLRHASVAARSYYWSGAKVSSCVGVRAARSFSTVPAQRTDLATKPATEKAFKGAEGLHKSVFHTFHFSPVWCSTSREEDKTPSAEALTTPDATSTVPSIVKGDWVLFHPVYSASELQAVEVRRSSDLRVRSP